VTNTVVTDVRPAAAVPQRRSDRWAALRRRPTRLVRACLQAAVGLGFLGVWEVAARTGAIDELLFSRPTSIVVRVAAMLGGEQVYGRTIYDHISITMQAILIGYVIGSVAGSLFGFLLGRSPFLAKVFEPYVLIFFAIPKIAIAPLFIIILGTGLQSKVAIVVMEVFFIMFYSTLRGVLQIKEDLIGLARVMGASRMTVLRSVLLPASLPSMLMGLRMAVPFAMIGAILGEYIASNRGIGWLVLYSGSSLDSTGTFAAIVFLLVLTWVLDRLVGVIEARTAPWLPKDEKSSAPATAG
jgi:NitT/TauT family transport system permease protein